ncbi:MAG: regulatory iron-sulfur-containing complex subunit RicT [Planctomycetota bacterium]|nr:regulatory iron-sulfur-containing complex subunit RicT [Planctomycetota bacterium]
MKTLGAEDREIYDRLQAPKTIVVRFGAMHLVGEFPYSGDAKPGCGSKLVVRTHRGTELGEMLTSTCPNSGCSKSVSRKQMLDYIENSGGRDYPFTTEGRVLRVATKEDLDKQAEIEQSKHELKLKARAVADPFGLPIKLVEAEPLLGGERLTFYFLSEDRVDFRDLVRALSDAFAQRVELRQVGARDEARLTADYERCGQYCCCKNFLKVLKPVSMRSAKIQKATLDPLKISGRCGRLMCCLRYEDQTYDDLRKRLPNRKSRVGTPEGDGMVLDSQILTQLVLVRLDAPNPDGSPKEVAVPVEELTPPKSATPPPPPALAAPPAHDRARRPDASRSEKGPRPDNGPRQAGAPRQDNGSRSRESSSGDRPRDDRRQKPRRAGDAPPNRPSSSTPQPPPSAPPHSLPPEPEPG